MDAAVWGGINVVGNQELRIHAVIVTTPGTGHAVMLMLKRHVQSLIDKSAFTKAIGAAAEYARRNPDCAAGHHLVAIAEEAAGYTRAAIQTVSHAIDLAPNEAAQRIMRARLLVKDHRIKEAIEDVEAIIATDDPCGNAKLLCAAMACRTELLERLSSTPRHRKNHQHTTGICSQFAG